MSLRGIPLSAVITPLAGEAWQSLPAGRQVVINRINFILTGLLHYARNDIVYIVYKEVYINPPPRKILGFNQS